MAATARKAPVDLPSAPLPALRSALAILLEEYRTQRNTRGEVKTAEWIERLFHLIGWSDGGPARVHRVGDVGNSELLECELFGFPAFQIAVVQEDLELTWAERTEAALTWLYNRGDEWAVVSDFERLDIVNVRWTDLAHSFIPFRTLEISTYQEHADTLALLSPRRIHQRDLFAQGEAEAPRVPIAKAKPGKLALRPPIEKAILDSVLASRNRFLALPPAGEVDAQRYDEQVHQLLLRMIFMRACEDMGLHVAQRLEELLLVEDIHGALGDVLTRYQALYESELFLPLELTQFDRGCLREAIRNLYVVSKVLRFNFAAVEADILGLMYEEYLKFRAVRKESGNGGSQEYLFVLERIGTENVRRKQGIYYTPGFLVEAMVTRAFEHLGMPDGQDGKSRPVVVADLACGSGTFLASAFRRIGEPLRDYHQAAGVLRECVLGLDSDVRAVEATRLNLWLTLFRLYPEVHPLPFLSGSVFSRDSLIGPVLQDVDAERDFLEAQDGVSPDVARLPRQPDLILGNPPFVALERQPPESRHLYEEEGYETLEKRADLANLFVERALDTVREGGIVALVVPNRIFTTSSAAALRKLIRGRARVEEIIDFGTLQLFDATTYVSVVFLRRVSAPPKQRAVDVVAFDKLIEPRELHLREGLAASPPPIGVRRLSVLLPEPGAPVFFVPRRAASLLGRVRARGIPVGQVADSPQGIRIGSQGLFLVEEVPGERVSGLNYLRVTSFKEVGPRGRATGELEREALRPAVHSKEIHRYKELPNNLWLIYPYDSEGKLIPFGEFETRFPRTALYLREHSGSLTMRARTTDQTWHKLAEPRDQRWLNARKVLCPQLARWGRMTLDDRGLYLVQGYAVIPRPGSAMPAEALLAALNSSLLVWALAMSSPRYRGDNFEYQGGIINALPLPRPLVEDLEVRTELEIVGKALLAAYNTPVSTESSAVVARLEATADALMYEAAGLSSSEVALVEEEVAPYRPPVTYVGAHEAFSLFANGGEQ